MEKSKSHSHRKGDQDAEEHADVISNLQQKLRDAVFTLLHEMARETNVTWPFLFLLWALDLLNVLVLPLAASPALPWDPSPLMRALWSVLAWLWFVPGGGDDFPQVAYSWATLFAVLAGWMSLVLVTVCWLTWAYMGYSDYTPRWMLVFLRVSSRVAIHGMWGTILMNLLDVFACEAGPRGTWRATGMSCWSGGHAALVAYVAILIAFVLAYHLTVALTVVNREPDFTGKKNLLGAPHGRVVAAVLLIKFIMSLILVFGETSAMTAAYLVPVLITGLAWLYIYLRYQPYYNGYLNGIQAAIACVYVSAAACGLLASGLGGSMGAQIGAVAWVFSLPLVVFTGWSMYNFYSAQYVTGKSMRGTHELELMSPYAVELRARAIILDSYRSGVDPRTDKAQKVGEDYYDSTARHGATTMKGVPGKGETGPAGGGHTAVNMSAETGPAGGGGGGAGLLTDYEALAAWAKEIRDAVCDLWRDASVSFGNNPMVYLFWANFHACISQNTHLERLMLREAVLKADWSHLDLYFFTWSRTLTLAQDAEAAGAAKMNVERRLRYEKLVIDSRECVAVAREQILSFWTELCAKHPDLAKLQSLGMTINDKLKESDRCFMELLELAPQNASVIRSYAEFLLELSNDPRKAQELLEDAEAIEDETAKSHLNASGRELSFALHVQDFDLSADSVGTIRVSSSRENMGAVLACSLAACRLVGYSQRELIGRSLSDLVPQPIGAVHDDIMSKFLLVGETRFLGTSRLTFVLHKAGYMVPSRVFVQPTGQDFHAVIDTAITPPGEAYVWCLGAHTGWQITASCETGLSLLGMDASAMRSGAMSMQHFLSDVNTVMEEASSKGSVRVTLRTSLGAHPGSKSDMTTQTKVTIKCQSIYIPAVGQPIYMMRIRRDAPGAASGRSRAFGGSQALLAGRSEDEPDRDGAGTPDSMDQAANSVGGEMGDDDRDGADSPPGKPPTPPHAHHHIVHHADMGDIDACPVVGRGVAGRGGKRPRFSGHLSGSFERKAGASALLPGAVAPGGSGDLSDLMAVMAAGPSEGTATANPTASHNGTPEADPARALSSELSDSSAPPRPSAAAPVPAEGGGPGPAKKRIMLQLPPDHVDSFVAEGGNTPAIENKKKARRTSLPPPAASPSVDSGLHQVIEEVGEEEEPSPSHDKKHDPHPHKEHVRTSHHSQHSHHSHGKETPRSALKSSNKVHPSPRGAHHQQAHHGDAHSEGSGGPGKDGQQGKAGSVHSKGSGKSGGSATSITEVVRRGVMSRSGKLESSLLTLRWAVVLMFVVTAALNLGSLLATQALMKQMMTNLDLVEMNGRRAVLAQRFYANVQDWRAAAVGMGDPVDMEYQKRRNDKYLVDFTALNEALYMAVDGSLPEESWLYINGSAITVLDYKNGTQSMSSFDGYETTSRTGNLANLASEMATRMRNILALNASRIMFVEPGGDVFWIAANGPGSLRVAMNNSLILADKRSSTQGDDIKRVDLIILIVSEIVFMLVIAVAIVPAVFRVSASKHRVFHTFIEVPLPIIKALRSSVQKRIEAIAKAEAEQDVGIDIAGGGNELEQDDEAAGELKALLRSQRAALADIKNGGKAAEEDEDMDLSAAVNATANVGGAVKKSRKASRRRYKGTDSARILTLLGFSWPVVAYMAYFAIMWWFKGTVVDTATQNRAQMLWSTQLELYVRLASIRLRWAYSFCDPDYITDQLNRAQFNLDFTSVLLDQVLYGSHERNLPAGLQEGHTAFNNLWMRSACFESESWFYQYSDCVNFRNGVVNRGLLGAYASYAEIGRKLIAARRQLAGDPACTTEHIELAGTAKADMSDLGNKYLASGFEMNTRLQFGVALSYLKEFDTFYTAVVALTIAALALLWLFVYSPQIYRLDKDIKNVRLLLLLFPDEVARTVPAVVAAGRQLLAEAGSSAGSAAGSVAR